MIRLSLFTCLFFLTQFSLFAQSYQSAESAAYDEANNRFLISNGANMLARSATDVLTVFGNGSTSFGLEVLGNTVFGVEGSSIVGYDLDTEDEVMSITISGASFLNGLTNDGQNTLYVSDFGANKIHKIDVSDFANPTQEIYLDNLADKPNGLLWDDFRLLYVTWGVGKIMEFNPNTNTITMLLNTGLTNIDGIDDDAAGNFYVSSWSPARITKYDSNFENPETISVPGISAPADIGYGQAVNILAVPQGSKVDYVDLNPIPNAQIDIIDRNLGLMVFPNPVSDSSYIQFELTEKATISLSLLDINGKLVHELLNGIENTGLHQVVLSGIDLPTGIYNCMLKANGVTEIAKIVVN